MRVQKLTLAAVSVVAGLSLTACSSSSDEPAKASGGTPTNPTASASTSGGGAAAGGSTTGGTAGTSGAGASGNAGSTTGGSGTSGSSTGGSGKTTGGSTGSNAASKSGRCTGDALTVTAADRTITGDEYGMVIVTLKNRSGKSCTIGGYAGVDLKTTSGAISAKRTGKESIAYATLKSGAETYFPISYPVNTSGGSGVRITGLLVTPPDTTKTVSLAWPGASSLPVTEGGGSSVEIGPMGSAGQGG